MQQWLLDVYDTFLDRENSDLRLNPSLLPGWAYARALVLRQVEDTTEEKVSHGADFSNNPLSYSRYRILQQV